MEIFLVVLGAAVWGKHPQSGGSENPRYKEYIKEFSKSQKQQLSLHTPNRLSVKSHPDNKKVASNLNHKRSLATL